MANEQALEYIKQRTAQGATREQIEGELRANGWQDSDVQTAFASSLQTPSAPSPYGPSLPGAGALLSEAWSLYTKKIQTFLAIMAVPAIGMLVYLFSVPPVISGQALDFSPTFIVLFIAVMFSQLWGQTSLLSAVSATEESFGATDALKRGLGLIFPFLWITVLSSFIIMGGFILLIIPGVLFAVWFSLTAFAFVADNQRGMNALLRSREYVRGNVGGVLWRFFLLMAVVMLISIAISSIANFVPNGAILSQVILTFTAIPLSTLYLFLIYRSLKALKGSALPTPTGKQKAVFIAVGIVGVLLVPFVLMSVVFSSLGSAREKARDALRQSDIRTIQAELELHKDKTGTYPESLSDIVPFRGTSLPTDPETKLPYAYTKVGADSYTVCADLQTREDVCVSP